MSDSNSFFIIRIFIYLFFVIHIVLSLNKVKVFPIFDWAMYSYTHPYRTLYIVEIVQGDREPHSLHTYYRANKSIINEALRVFGLRINKYQFNRDSEEFKKWQTELEEYIVKIHSPPPSFFYQLVKQKVHLPFYVLSKEGSILSKEIILKGNL